jgi:hypothetical protein
VELLLMIGRSYAADDEPGLSRMETVFELGKPAGVSLV